MLGFTITLFVCVNKIKYSAVSP